MKLEQAFWRDKLKPFVQGWVGDDYDRVESSTSDGIPDLHLTVSKHHWIELKAVRYEENKKLDLSHYTAMQKSWARRHGSKTNSVWLMVHVVDYPEKNKSVTYLLAWYNAVILPKRVDIEQLYRQCETLHHSAPRRS